VSGSGMVMHTCNPRLQAQQLIYIINHAEDAAMLFDSTFAPLIKGIAPHCPKVKHWICLSDAAHLPEVEGVGTVCYEALLAPHSEQFDWPEFDERSGAALCYTSGTTGNPKGALYSHRAIVINALSCCLRHAGTRIGVGRLARDVTAVKLDPSRIRHIETRHQRKQGGLAGPVGANQRGQAAWRHRQTDVMHGSETAETLADLAYRQQACAHGVLPFHRARRLLPAPLRPRGANMIISTSTVP